MTSFDWRTYAADRSVPSWRVVNAVRADWPRDQRFREPVKPAHIDGLVASEDGMAAWVKALIEDLAEVKA